MTLNYYLTKEDFLTFQLYAASQSKRIRQRRIMSRLIVPVLYVIIGLLLMFLENNIAFPIAFTVFAALWLIFYPLYLRWLYKRHYRKYVEENNANSFGVEAEMGMDGEYLLTRDKTGEGKVKISEVDGISEISTHYFIKMNKGISFIFPKERFDGDQLINFIEELCRIREISVIDHTGWKWK